ncbi:hypothetical protein [Streptomyces sp. NPDC004788]
MAIGQSGSTSAAGRGNRFAAGGCLTILGVLTVVCAIVLSWLWYRAGHDEQVSHESRQKALAGLERRAERAKDESLQSLRERGTADAETLTGVIAQHTGAPVIRYDAAHRRFTATVEETADYEKINILRPGADRVKRCVAFTFSRGPDGLWTGRTEQRDGRVCQPVQEIGDQARYLRSRLARLADGDLTSAGVKELLKAKSVVVEGGTVRAVTVVFSYDKALGQCYRFTRPFADGAADELDAATRAVPVPDC